MRKATIIDVAELAGVSIKSVSRVVNNEPNVRPTLREKVQGAIDKLGYKPNLAARSLAAGRSLTVGILFDNPSPNYTMKVQEGAYAASQRAGYQLVFEKIDTTAENVAHVMDAMLANRRMDGMVVTPPATDCVAVLDALECYKLPYVRIAPYSNPGRSSAIFANDREAVEELVQHLWDAGHRHFGFIGGPPAHGASLWRQQGFFTALERLKVPLATVRSAFGDFSFASGITAGRALLEVEQRPSAIFATNDDMAAGAFVAAAQLGIKIPDALSITGFDDSWIARSVWPELTTMHQPIAEMAFDAIDILTGATNADDMPERRHRCSLVVRGSSGPAPAA